MNKRLLFAICFASTFVSAVVQGQLPAVDWKNVNSYATWMNSYNEPGQLTLVVNNVPAMRKLRPGSVFARTKFPPGSFRAEIVDSRTGKAIEVFPLTIKDQTSLLIISKGDDKVGCEVFQISSADDASENGSRSVTFVNAFPGGKLTVSIGGAESVPIRVEGISSIPVSRVSESEVPAVVELIAPNGQKRQEEISLTRHVERGAVFVFHCDDTDPNVIRFTLFDGETFSVLETDGPDPSAE